MPADVSTVVNIGGFFFLLMLGWMAGRVNERRHYRRIVARERGLAGILVFSDRLLPTGTPASDGHLVLGSVVVAQDYFKMVAAALRNLFGGRLRAYESLLDRGRREAVLRMKEQARQDGADAVFNVKFVTSRIGMGIEVVAYGTAVRLGQG